ncbi:MAG: SusD/RagB family nutrient-binding outer membrane lipoprotein [Leeuwenhoekiella sp.]|nr:MAG: SusD/RagB family nutrient-binding outer membrane lipoprotein [Leeuwenhoekiella sp.]
MKTLKFLIAGFLVCVLSSCSTNFEEINTDPNNLEEITAGSALNPILYELTTHNALQHRNIGAQLMQMFIPNEDNTNAVFYYDFVQNIGGSTWNTYYSELTNIKEMEKAAVRDELPNYEAIALTLKAYAFSILTDCFGDVPMLEAGSAEEGVWFPKFTEQETIYTQILEDLERANSLYDTDQAMPYVSDILYQNDVAKWQKFTNSLHMRLLLRTVNRNASAYTELATLANNPATYPVFTSNDDHAVLKISGEAPLLSPWSRPQDFNTFRVYNAFFIDHLKEFEDPRLPVFATEAMGLNNERYGYIGLPIDFRNDPVADSIATVSGPRQQLAIAPLSVPLMSYAEVEFIKAELAQRGLITNAQEHYENGVEAALTMWSVSAPANYFDNTATAYDGTLERIMLQKYFALFFTDYQAWFEHRRTGLPQLPVSSDMKNNQEMPSRLYYPIDEADRNNQNYKAAVERMGGDEINIKVWWDK